MKIGIDTTSAAQPRVVGISRFVVNLVTELAAMPGDDEYYLYYRLRALRHPRAIWRPRDRRFHVRLLPRLGVVDVYHATDNRLPRSDGARFLGTLHDVFYLSQPDSGSTRTRTKWQARYRDLAARAPLIMTVSEFSKSEIVRLLGVSPARVRVVPLAPSGGYTPQPQAAIAAVRQRYGLMPPYILFGGGFARRKNALGAVRAFARALPRLPVDVTFALAGGGGPLAAAVRAGIQDAGLTKRVMLLDFIPEADHAALISGCLLYFFPTLLEGFGLPALEAMACGAPLLTSATTALPEICGDAAVLVDPTDEEALAAGLVELSMNRALRATLIERGLRRAREFSWRRVAETVRGLYRELA